jgi:hypothetical protein
MLPVDSLTCWRGSKQPHSRFVLLDHQLVCCLLSRVLLAPS